MATDLDATLLPLRPDWRQGYVQTFEYRTEILTSRSGKEQRRALRKLARKAVEFTALVSGGDLNTLNRTLAQHQNDNFLLPDLTRTAALGAPVSAAASSFTLDPIPDWLTEGIWIVLVHGTDTEAALVDDVTGTTVALDDPLGLGWPAGTRVCRGITGLLDDDLRAQMQVNTLARAAVRFQVNPGTDTFDDSGTAETTFNGREVFTLRPNWSSPLDVTYSNSPERVDFGRGVIHSFRPVDFPSRLFRASFVGRTTEEGGAIRRLFGRMKGQRGEFYMPTGVNDLPPLGPLSGGAATLTVAGTATASAYADSTVFKAISVRLADGSEIRRTVSGIGTSGGNSVMTVGSPWESTMNPADIVMISWLPVWRFASDLLTLEWLTGEVVQTALPMQMLEDL